MADGQPADLQTVIDTTTLAAKTRQREFDLYNQARSKADLAGLAAHYQGYQTALGVEQKANEVVVQQIVDGAELQTDLQMLAQANTELSDAADQLAAATAALGAFTQAATAVLTVLGAIAIL